MGCGGATQGPAATPEPTAAPSVATTAPSTPAATAGADAIRWEIVGERSTATVRVREQLATIPAPIDAVITAPASGSFALLPDGTFGEGSAITVDLTRIASDSAQRDRYVRTTSLETGRYPTATFVPTRTEGLALPLPEGAEFTFRLIGDLTVRAVQREVSFMVTARRDGGILTATAIADPTWTFAEFGMSVPRAAIVLSVVDEIRLQIDLVAREA